MSLGWAPPGAFTLGATPGLLAVLPRIELPTHVTLDPQITALTVNPAPAAAVLDPQTTEVVIDG